MDQSELEAKICNRHKARENVQPVPSAGKHATGTKRGKTFNRRQARENMPSALSAGKYCNRRQARENM